jgi:hypothetical protein
MSYDLRRLRLHRLIERIAHTHRYRLSLSGMKTALSYVRVYQRLLLPGLSHLDDLTLAGSSPLTAAAQRLQAELDGFINQQLPAWKLDLPTRTFEFEGLLVVCSPASETFLRIVFREHQLSFCSPDGLVRRLDEKGQWNIDLVLHEVETAVLEGIAKAVEVANKHPSKPPIIALIRLADRITAAELVTHKVAKCLCWPADVDTWTR